MASLITSLKKKLSDFRTPAHLRSGEAYVDWLRSKGVRVGRNVKVMSPRNIKVDVSRPELIEIGDNVLLHNGTVIMAHDFASRAFVNKYSVFLPSHGKIKIGNNVWLGENVTILKGVTIGDNVVIGYGSLVTKDIPSDSLAIGRPAKRICSFDEYFHKREKQFVEEAIEYALEIYACGRTPVKEDFYDDYPAFVDGHNYKEYDYPYSRVFTSDKFEEWKRTYKAPFDGFDEFMKEVDRRRENRKANS